MSKVAKYWDQEKKVIRASNGQVVWDYAGRGFITVDTPVGGAVIGFGGEREHALSDMTIRYDNPFANVYVVAEKPGQTLANAEQLIILTMARTANKGDVYEETHSTPLVSRAVERTARGAEHQREEYMSNPTLIIEPVKTAITWKDARPFKVYALDHDGCKTARPIEVPVSNRQFVLDGAKYQTMYYAVEFGK
jgi:hypothetical protein